MTTIEAGRWYRYTDGTAAMAVRLWTRDKWECRGVGGSTWYVRIEDLTPWTPWVGDWVRVTSMVGSHWYTVGTVGRVDRTDLGDGIFTLDTGRTLPESRLDPVGPWLVADLVEPCPPPASEAPAKAPAAPPAPGAVDLPPLREWLAQVDDRRIPPRPRRDDGHRCPRCGGPAYMGLGLTPPECVAPKCEPVTCEPTVREAWLSVRGTVVDAGHPRAERLYVAEGHGWTAQHPIRSEAVARWREVVGRG